MSTLICKLVLTLTFLNLIAIHEAAPPLFLQAITSALATIPFTGGPMTTGLVGAKLGIGTKLLYYLGFFGRRSRSKPKPKPKAKSKPKTASQKPARSKPLGAAQLPGGNPAMSSPSMLNGGFPQGGGFGSPMGGGFPTQGGGFPGQGGGFGNPALGAGGFPQMGAGFGNQMMGGGFGSPSMGAGGFQPMGGFGGPGMSGGGQISGFDPSQVFAALRAQGFDAQTAMQIVNNGAVNNNFNANPAGNDFSMNGGFAGNNPQGGFEQISGPGFDDIESPEGTKQPNDDHQDADAHEDEEDGGDSEDVESFFNFLKDMDDNTCISRLICDIGADPSFLGDFSENIHGIVGSLNVQPTSGAYPYIGIMERGRNEGDCAGKFPECSDGAYEIVKNVAPSVGLPQNVNSEAINQL